MRPHPKESAATSSITNRDDIIEAVRLTNKAHLLIRSLGSLLPGLSPDHVERLTTVLEISCGPGVWTQEFAKAHPHIQITGVDTSRTMLTSARKMLYRRDLSNAEYVEIPHFVGPYPFDEASFDLIRTQFVSKFLTVDDWPPFLSACKRLLRPGGLIHITEFETGFSNAPAYEELSQLFIHAMRLAGRSFSLSDRHLGLLCELEPLLYAAGFQDRSSLAHMINCSYGAPIYEEWKKDFQILSREVQPLIVQMQLATQEHIDALNQQQHYEMDIPTFHAMFPLLTIWGTKP